jgi:hypothetical protein
MSLDRHYAAIEAEAVRFPLSVEEIAWEQVEHWKSIGLTPVDAMRCLGPRRVGCDWNAVFRQVEAETVLLMNDPRFGKDD